MKKYIYDFILAILIITVAAGLFFLLKSKGSRNFLNDILKFASHQTVSKPHQSVQAPSKVVKVHPAPKGDVKVVDKTNKIKEQHSTDETQKMRAQSNVDITIKDNQQETAVVEDQENEIEEIVKKEEAKEVVIPQDSGEIPEKIDVQIQEDSLNDQIESKENSLEEKPEEETYETEIEKENEIDLTQSAEEEKSKMLIDDIEFKMLSYDELEEKVNHHELKDSLLALMAKSDKKTREETIQKMLILDKKLIQTLKVFLGSPDPFFTQNCSYLLGVFNCIDSLPFFMSRIQEEKNELLKNALMKSMALIEHVDVKMYLKDLFLESDQKTLLYELCDQLIETSYIDVTKKAQKLIKQNKKDILYLSYLHKLLIASNLDQALTFARENLKHADKQVKENCLEILFYTQDDNDWTLINSFKRKYYSSIELMQAYLKVKAKILTRKENLPARYEKMENYFKNDPPLLSWLALYVSKKTDDISKMWIKEFFLRHNQLTDDPNFIRALQIQGVDIKTLKQSSQDSLNMNSSANDNQIRTLLGSGDIRINSYKKGIFLYLDGIAQVIDEQGWVKKIPEGIYEMKVRYNNDEIKRMVQIEDKVVISISISDIEYFKPEKNSVGIDLVLVPACEQFTMGDDEIYLNEHLVSISNPLYVSVYETTNHQYEQFDSSHKQFRDKNSHEDDQPVIMITWYEAVDFCNWLSDREKLFPCYDENYVFKPENNGYRLPLEAEWEYIARAGIEKMKYPWGNEIKGDGIYFCNYAPRDNPGIDGYEFTAPVGQYQPNEYGLYDIVGNVSEWCQDWFGDTYYSYFNKETVTIDPKGPKDGSLKVLRGGSWRSRDAINLAYREHAHPSDRSISRGLRIVRTSEKFNMILKYIPKEELDS